MRALEKMLGTFFETRSTKETKKNPAGPAFHHIISLMFQISLATTRTSNSKVMYLGALSPSKVDNLFL
jgi:hypothetical protein